MLRQLAALLRAYASMVPQLLAISGFLGLSIPSGHCHPQGPSGSGATARNVHPLHDGAAATCTCFQHQRVVLHQLYNSL